MSAEDIQNIQIDIQERILQQLEKLNANMANQNQSLDDLKQLSLLTEHGFPMSSLWSWQQFVRDASLVIPPGGKQGENIINDNNLSSKYGWLHSLALNINSSALHFSLKYTSLGREFESAATIAEFWVADFNEHHTSPGDPVVIYRTALGLSTPPEWTVRIGPSFNIPFNVPFTFSLTNPGTTDITIYAWSVFFIMLKPTGKLKDWVDKNIKEGTMK